MAIDIKKILTGLKERKETMLVRGLGAITIFLAVFLLIGYMRGISPPTSLEVIVKRKRPMKSNEEIAEEAVAELKEAQKIPPFISYQDILTRNLFIQSRMARVEEEGIVGVGGFVLKGIIQVEDEIKAFIDDPAGKSHLVGVGQTVGTSEVKMVAIDFKNQSVAILGKSWEKLQVIKMAREILGEKSVVTFRPSERKKEAGKPKEVTEEEAKKAIVSAKRAISKVDSLIVDASATGIDTSEAVEKRDAVQEKLTRAQAVSLTREYAQAKALALEAEELAEEAVLLMEEAEIREVEEEEEEE